MFTTTQKKIVHLNLSSCSVKKILLAILLITLLVLSQRNDNGFCLRQAQATWWRGLSLSKATTYPSFPNFVWERNCPANSVCLVIETKFLRQARSQSGDWEREGGTITRQSQFDLLLVSGLLLMTARGQGRNFITAQVKIEAKVTGRDPCDILLEWRTEARQAGDTKLALTIEAAEKFMGCRNQQNGGANAKMTWYAAHAIMVVQFKDGQQDNYPLWENIILIEARDSQEALAKAEARAKLNEGDYDNSFTWNDRPAMWRFAGIRQLLTVQEETERPTDGTEISYTEMAVTTQAELDALVQGEVVTVQYTA